MSGWDGEDDDGAPICPACGVTALPAEDGHGFACENPEGLVGGTVYHERGDVGRAGAVEVHLAPDGTLAGYGAGLLPLDAPTEAPAAIWNGLAAWLPPSASSSPAMMPTS